MRRRPQQKPRACATTPLALFAALNRTPSTSSATISPGRDGSAGERRPGKVAGVPYVLTMLMMNTLGAILALRISDSTGLAATQVFSWQEASSNPAAQDRDRIVNEHTTLFLDRSWAIWRPIGQRQREPETRWKSEKRRDERESCPVRLGVAAGNKWSVVPRSNPPFTYLGSGTRNPMQIRVGDRQHSILLWVPSRELPRYACPIFGCLAPLRYAVND